jgi:hypothetical protein
MTTYADTLAAARRVGAAHANDAQLMALFCDANIQMLCGAVSPKLVWEGAQHKGLTTNELMSLTRDPFAIADLQWESL